MCDKHPRQDKFRQKIYKKPQRLKTIQIVRRGGRWGVLQKSFPPPGSFFPPLREVPFFCLPAFGHRGGLLPLAVFAIRGKALNLLQ